MSETTSTVHRRSFLQGALGVGAGLALAGPFSALAARAAAAAPAGGPGHGHGHGPGHGHRPPGRPGDGGYGPLHPPRGHTTGVGLIQLPRGGEYMTFGWCNDRMSDGTPTPSLHDGMAAFRRGRHVHLVRNHEQGAGTPFAPDGAVYDQAAGGGTTTLVFDPHRGRLVESYASLSGTIRNCAGGPTPRGTWLTCEETTDIVGGVRHGCVRGLLRGTVNPVPIVGMGRFSHGARRPTRGRGSSTRPRTPGPRSTATSRTT